MVKKILVTGAAGFIGYHVSKALINRGDHVVGLDNFNDYYSPRLKLDRSALLKDAHINVIKGDICDYGCLENVIEAEGITYIIHLAAQAGVRYSLQNPSAYLKSNIDGFLNILEICRKHRHIKLTYASSSSVYGLNKETPFRINDRTDQQASLYGVTKKTNELMASTYHHLFGISVTGLRYFTVYGPWGRPDMAYFSFTENIMNQIPIMIYNNGAMARDFTYIDDIVKGTIAAMDLEAACEVFNLGNHRPVALLDFIEIIEKALGRKAIKKFTTMQDGDVVDTYADIEKSQRLLGFEPSTKIEEGICHFIDWYLDYKIGMG